MNTTAAAPSAGSNWTSIIMLVALFAIMYFIIIRPQQKKDKQLKQMRDAIKVGDDIVTIGGIYGKVLKVSDEKVVIATGAVQTKMEIAKWAISTVVGKKDEAPKKNIKEDNPEEDKKASPKSIRKLGAKSEEAVQEVSETVAKVEEAVEGKAE